MEPIRAVQTKDNIARILRNGIFSGELVDGEELVQELVAEKLGVSRMPVREALQMLEQEGFLERLPNRHMRVVEVKHREILQNFRVLAAVEMEIALLLLLEKKDLAPLAHSLEACRTAAAQGEPEECAGCEMDFHLQLSGLLENKTLSRLHQRLLGGQFAYALQSVPRNPQMALKGLEAVLCAMEGKGQEGLRTSLDNYFDEIAAGMGKEVKP
ncbi:GntR family transcriptional regulator [Anaerotalea alkaliphila]|uniref:GntR family transcriptional regulator n=1 Tax=Anaerotalea alkaliphila TaxID=2662126 RepID=A0A7X5KLL6_9FIRM|nr:GntR family transcriptional regulator [Anaerotalea alkaliphila]NDL66829.1 GntR family transcriptional regulator [Anaerotalea alkaliphila]